MPYDSVTLYENTKVDYLICMSREATVGEIATADGTTFLPTWASFTDIEIMAPFTTGLVSSYVSGLTSPIINYVIYRQKIGETLLTKVATVDTSVNKIWDYGVENHTEYKWLVFPATATEFGVSLESAPLTTCWGSWSIIELVPTIYDGFYNAGEVWIFGLNLDAGEIGQNLDQTIFPTYSQFPKISAGQANYKTLSFSSLISNVSSTSSNYTDSVSLKRDWDAFVAKNLPVLLKDRKGHVYYGLLQTPTANINNVSGSLPTTISVSFVELGNFEDVSVFSEV